MEHTKFDRIDAALVIFCALAMALLGLYIYIAVNSPMTDSDGDEYITSSLTYSDYIDFVEKEEKCLN